MCGFAVGKRRWAIDCIPREGQVPIAHYANRHVLYTGDSLVDNSGRLPNAILLVNIWEGSPPYAHPLNCHLAPVQKHATTRFLNGEQASMTNQNAAKKVHISSRYMHQQLHSSTAAPSHPIAHGHFWANSKLDTSKRAAHQSVARNFDASSRM